MKVGPKGWRQDRPRIRELLKAEQSPGIITVEGWVRTVRHGKGVTFLAINDGSCLASLQVVVDAATPANAALAGIGTGACVRVGGRMVASPGSEQRWEVQASFSMKSFAAFLPWKGDESLIPSDLPTPTLDPAASPPPSETAP